MLELSTLFTEHWEVKLVSAVLIWAAYIDGKQLRVPNWMTFPMIFSGLLYHGIASGMDGLTMSLWGACVGLLCLLPLYAVGGMGAGDVKLMAGIGAWLGATVTWHAFIVTVVVGAIMAVIMVLRRGAWTHHFNQFKLIWTEWITIKDPSVLSEIAARRKPTMFLLPYGIPICIGSIAYFLYAGLL
jgi:prepilin peptidase CpaA